MRAALGTLNALIGLMKHTISIALIMMAASCASDFEVDVDCDSCDGKTSEVGVLEPIPLAFCQFDSNAPDPNTVKCDEISKGSRYGFDIFYGLRGTPSEYASAGNFLGQGISLSEGWKPDTSIQLMFEYSLHSLVGQSAPSNIVSSEETVVVSAQQLKDGFTFYSRYTHLPLSFISTNAINVYVVFDYDIDVYTDNWSKSYSSSLPYSDTLHLELWKGRANAKLLFDGTHSPVVDTVVFSNALDTPVAEFNDNFLISGPMNLTADRFSGLRLEEPEDTEF